ncbi:MAG TPA: hypothetical protein VH331_11215 [Allosphingosinicella sp.]|jgi:FtsH-binding integral membrane protein|nr:hypothetical protein [Allosphingosinicella sp.]
MMTDPDAPPRLPSKGLPVVAYCVCLLGALYVFAAFHPTGLWAVLTVAAPVLALGWLLTVVLRQRRAKVCETSPAQRAYVRRFLPMIVLYIVILFGVVWLQDRIKPAGPLAIVLAILPALPLLGVIWALGRLVIEEQDEYLRSLIVRQFMIATGFMLTVTSIWGFLDAFDQVPHVPMYWAFIIWCIGLGVGTVANEMRS